MKKTHLAALASIASLALTPIAASPAHAAAATSFTLDGKVIDGGQQVVSVTLETTRYRINPKSLNVNTFRVHAKGSNPYPELAGDTSVATYDRDRTITDIRLDRDGDIVISMVSGEDAPAAFTFSWSNQVRRNILLDLDYSIEQRQPVRSKGNKTITFSRLTQGKLVDAEVDRFTSGTSDDGMSYHLFTPRQARPKNPRPLVLWLHGGGEGGWSGAYGNELPLAANRGALAFATPEAQRIFKGAYVVAPQADTRWWANATMGYSQRIKALLDELVAQYDIDTSRIYVAGPSNGGYMTLQMVADHPDLFAAAVPICPGRLDTSRQVMISDEELLRMRDTPTWIVQARNDNVLPFVDNGQYVHELLGTSTLTAYPDVVWDGHTFGGHFSWIYSAHNDPTNEHGQHLWQWMAAQHR